MEDKSGQQPDDKNAVQKLYDGVNEILDKIVEEGVDAATTRAARRQREEELYNAPRDAIKKKRYDGPLDYNQIPGGLAMLFRHLRKK